MLVTCTHLRQAITISALLLSSGFFLQALAEIFGMAVPAAHLALFFVLGAALILGATFVLVLLPGSARSLSKCVH